jgi:hypothetical protein
MGCSVSAYGMAGAESEWIFFLTARWASTRDDARLVRGRGRFG